MPRICRLPASGPQSAGRWASAHRGHVLVRLDRPHQPYLGGDLRDEVNEGHRWMIGVRLHRGLGMIIRADSRHRTELACLRTRLRKVFTRVRLLIFGACALVLLAALLVITRPWQSPAHPAGTVWADPATSDSAGVASSGSPSPSPRRSVSPAPGASAKPAPPGWQPGFPIRATFYYPWFPEGWKQQGMNPFTRFHPTLGSYDLNSAQVLAAHIKALRYAGQQAGIASWWGAGAVTDRHLGQLLRATAGQQFRWSVYHEGEGQADPSVSQLTADLTYLRDHYGNDPSFLRIGGRFVVFVYADGNDACGMADRWKRANTVGAYIVLKVFPGFKGCASQPDGWHQYGPASPHSDQSPYSYTISPGFWKANEPSARLPRNPATFRQDVQSMAASGARFQLVTTFNEWGEGTAVENASEWASGSGMGQYLDALHDVFGPV